MRLVKSFVKFISVICITLNLSGCGLYMISKNEDIIANTVIGTPKSSIKDKIFAADGSGNCNIFGRVGNDVYESCSILLSATDVSKNNILYENDVFLTVGNVKNYSINLFNTLNDSSTVLKNKAIILLTRDNIGLIGARGIVDVYINDKKATELIGHETAYIWIQDPSEVKLEVKQKDWLLNSVVFKAEKGLKYHFVYNYLTGAVNPMGDENSKIYFTSYPPGASVYAGTDPSALKPTHILTPHTMTRLPRSDKWGIEYYMLKLEGYKDSPILFKNNSFGDRIVHYNFIDPSIPEPPLSELPIKRNDPSKPLITPAIPL